MASCYLSNLSQHVPASCLRAGGCGGPAGQALAQAFAQASAAGRGGAVAQALAQAQATSAQQVREGLIDEGVLLELQPAPGAAQGWTSLLAGTTNACAVVGQLPSGGQHIVCLLPTGTR
jgi:hypothetical protein